jgi:hypothetical protein
MTAACPPSAPGVRAYDFYSKFGVNGNLDSGGTVAHELADMAYVGIPNIRSSAYNANSGDAISWMQANALLSAQGIRQHIDVQAAAGVPFGLMSDWISALKTYIVTPYGANMVTGVSGPNETDTGQYFAYNSLTGIAAANAAQHDLYVAMKADPALSSIPVDMWPLGLYSTGQGVVGDQTASCDRGNMHDYYAVDNNTPLQGVGPAGDIEQRMANFSASFNFVSYYKGVCNKPVIITTETGYGSTTCANCDASASEYVQSRLAMTDMLAHASTPYLQEVYYFTLRWGSPGASGNWGLINDDGSPKPSGTAMHNLMAIIKDPGGNAATFTPVALGYSLAGMPALGGAAAIQKSGGASDIILWNETPIWVISSATPVSITPSSVTVSLVATPSAIRVYDPINGGTTPIATYGAVNSIMVSLNDAPLVIEVSP